jgi:hypothetical protein
MMVGRWLSVPVEMEASLARALEVMDRRRGQGQPVPAWARSRYLTRILYGTDRVDHCTTPSASCMRFPCFDSQSRERWQDRDDRIDLIDHCHKVSLGPQNHPKKTHIL